MPVESVASFRRGRSPFAAVEPVEADGEPVRPAGPGTVVSLEPIEVVASDEIETALRARRAELTALHLKHRAARRAAEAAEEERAALATAGTAEAAAARRRQLDEEQAERRRAHEAELAAARLAAAEQVDRARAAAAALVAEARDGLLASLGVGGAAPVPPDGDASGAEPVAAVEVDEPEAAPVPARVEEPPVIDIRDEPAEPAPPAPEPSPPVEPAPAAVPPHAGLPLVTVLVPAADGSGALVPMLAQLPGSAPIATSPFVTSADPGARAATVIPATSVTGPHPTVVAGPAAAPATTAPSGTFLTRVLHLDVVLPLLAALIVLAIFLAWVL